MFDLIENAKLWIIWLIKWTVLSGTWRKTAAIISELVFHTLGASIMCPVKSSEFACDPRLLTRGPECLIRRIDAFLSPFRVAKHPAHSAQYPQECAHFAGAASLLPASLSISLRRQAPSIEAAARMASARAYERQQAPSAPVRCDVRERRQYARGARLSLAALVITLISL